MLISNISTLASVYHKPPEFFVKDGKSGLTLKANKGDRKNESDEESSDEEDEDPVESSAPDEDEDEDLEDDDDDETDTKTGAPGGPSKSTPSASSSGGLVDLLGIGSFDAPSPARPTTTAATGRIVLTTENGKGLQLRSKIARRSGVTYMDLTFENQTSQVLSQFAIKFNDNFCGIVPGAAPGPLPVGAVAPGTSKLYSLPLAEQKPVGANAYGLLQVAIKTELGVFYFNESLHPFHLFDESGKVPDKEFLGLWKAIDDSKEQTNNVANRVVNDQEEIKQRFASYNIFFIAARPVATGVALYFSIRWRNTVLLIEVKVNGSQTTTAVKSENVELAKATSQGLAALLTIPQAQL